MFTFKNGEKVTIHMTSGKFFFGAVRSQTDELLCIEPANEQRVDYYEILKSDIVVVSRQK